MAVASGSSALSLAIKAVIVSRLLPERTSRARASPSLSTTAPDLAASQASCTANLAEIVAQSASVKDTSIFKSGLTTSDWKIARAAAHAGLTEPLNGKG